MKYMFTPTEKQQFISYVEAYGKDGSHLDVSAPFETLTRVWKEEKGRYLIDLFGGKTQLIKEINLKKDRHIITKDFINCLCINSSVHALFCNLYDLVFNSNNYYFDEGGYVRTLVDPCCQDIWKLNQTEITTFCENKIMRDINLYKEGTNETVLKINKGTKYTKFLKKIIKFFLEKEKSNNPSSFSNIFSDAAIESFCLEYSKILNDTSLTGNLVLSIHPLDYITMSDNEYDWSSCMSWKNNGCYHGGTVEMMNSPSVIVAYLAGDKPMTLPDGSAWSNKKWRELFIVRPDGVIGVKPYPYYCSVIEEEVLCWLKDLMKVHFNRKYSVNKRTHFDCSQFYTDTFMYNDFECRDDDGNPYFDDENGDDFTYEEFCYSGPATCMGCGEYLYSDNIFSRNCLEAVTYCEKCSGCYKICPICGEFHPCDNWIEELEVHVCSNCYANKTFYNDLNGQNELITEENYPLCLKIETEEEINIPNYWNDSFSLEHGERYIFRSIGKKSFDERIMPYLKENGYKTVEKNKTTIIKISTNHIKEEDSIYISQYEYFVEESSRIIDEIWKLN